MSTDPAQSSPDALARRRAAWALGALALGAAIIGAVMVFWLGTSGGTHDNAAPPARAASVSGGARSSTTPPTHTAAPSPTRTSPNPTRSTSGTPVTASCPTSAPCVLPGDAGQAGTAIDSYRTSHHQPSVAASVSPAAQSCALHSGDGRSCPTSYFWEPVATPDGTAVIAKIAAANNGNSWLLDPHAASFAVGWAYAPGAAGTAGQVEAVVVKVDNTG